MQTPDCSLAFVFFFCSLPNSHCETPNNQVVGVESTDCTREAQEGQYLVRHIRALQRLRGFSRSGFEVIVEKNYGGPAWATWHATACRRSGLNEVRFGRRKANSGEVQKQAGVVTTKENKNMMMEQLQSLVHLHQLKFSKRIVSVCTSEKNASDMVRETMFQLEGYRERIQKDLNDPSRPARRELSGKIGPAGRDDLVDCLALLLFWPRLLVFDFI